MIDVSDLYSFFNNISNFYTGIPDSTLKEYINYIYSKSEQNECTHILASNEGNAVGLATGYYISTRKNPIVYMQNSGIGNAVNPITSLTEIYNVPIMYLIGWRGTPGIKDEPQHKKMGEITLDILDLLGIKYFVIDEETQIDDIKSIYENDFQELLNNGKSVAYIVKPGVLMSNEKYSYSNENSIEREYLIDKIISHQDENDVIVSTTGKTSRELFECREKRNEPHNKDFLTVGSMGHSSSIALAISLQTKNRVWCLDGDGAMLMHLGALTTVGKNKPSNLIHILINNGSHESVGGLYTLAPSVDWEKLALACGYKNYLLIQNEEDIDKVLDYAKTISGPVFIEAKVKIYSRKDLGRPTIAPEDNIKDLMNYLN